MKTEFLITEDTEPTAQNAGQRTAAVLAFTYLGEAQRSIDAAARMGAFTDQEIYWLNDLGQRLGRFRAGLAVRQN